MGISSCGIDLGRVVITHSTYVEGLIPWLQSLAAEKEIKTITPAVINRVRGRSPLLQLRVSTAIRGGFKLVARQHGAGSLCCHPTGQRTTRGCAGTASPLTRLIIQMPVGKLLDMHCADQHPHRRASPSLRG